MTPHPPLHQDWALGLVLLRLVLAVLSVWVKYVRDPQALLNGIEVRGVTSRCSHIPHRSHLL